MTPEPDLERRAYALFCQLLPLDAPARDLRLDGETPGEPELRAAVEALLAADAATGPLDAVDPWALEGAPLPEPLTSRPTPAELEPGKVVAGYRLLRALGAGGMGRVYEAHRADGTLDRRVAIKLLERDLRFLDEGRALATLEHPNIARIYEAGRVEAPGKDDDREPPPFVGPYLVMERIDGVTITEHCRQRDLDLDQRIELFLGVCDAVAEAHRQRVVHGDLKPANILVDREGNPKLLDFGIATFLDRPDARSSTFRAFTPAYSAPEQILGGEITPATDVHTLGLLLYELLTDQRAVEAPDTDLDAIFQQICDTEPPLPSRAFGDRPSPSSTPLARLRQRLEGDLDTIVSKALRKAPEQRYPTARELAGDLRRWRSHRPITARPVGPGARFAKFVRRHPVATAAVLVTVLTLAISALVMDWQRRQADDARARAEHETRRANQVSELVRWSFATNSPEENLGNDALATDLLASGVERLATLEPAETRVELALVLARAYQRMGHEDEATRLLTTVRQDEPIGELSSTLRSELDGTLESLNGAAP